MFCLTQSLVSISTLRVHDSTDVDAGKITFENSAKLLTDKSIGFRLQDVDYCAAPILAGNSTANLPRAHFWAVGKDCCDARGNFRCDGALDKTVHSGLVLHDAGARDFAYHSFVTAV